MRYWLLRRTVDSDWDEMLNAIGADLHREMEEYVADGSELQADNLTAWALAETAMHTLRNYRASADQL